MRVGNAHRRVLVLRHQPRQRLGALVLVVEGVGGRWGQVRAGQHPFQGLAHRASRGGLGVQVHVDELVDHHVQAVGLPPARGTGVQLLAAGAGVHEVVCGGGRHALHAVDRGRIPELDVLGDVVRGQGHEPAVRQVAHVQRPVVVAFGHVPQVTVLHEVRAPAHAELPVVASGDDHITHTGP